MNINERVFVEEHIMNLERIEDLTFKIPQIGNAKDIIEIVSKSLGKSYSSTFRELRFSVEPKVKDALRLSYDIHFLVAKYIGAESVDIGYKHYFEDMKGNTFDFTSRAKFDVKKGDTCAVYGYYYFTESGRIFFTYISVSPISAPEYDFYKKYKDTYSFEHNLNDISFNYPLREIFEDENMNVKFPSMYNKKIGLSDRLNAPSINKIRDTFIQSGREAAIIEYELLLKAKERNSNDHNSANRVV